MNGPGHYREAERLLAAARLDIEAGPFEGNRREHDHQVARAQVHATLALAAATVNAADTTSADYSDRDGLTGSHTEPADNTAWTEVIYGPPLTGSSEGPTSSST